MSSTQNSSNNVRVTEGEVQPQENGTPEGNRQKMEQLKKPVIFSLMAVVFIGCMYLIFKPSDKKQADNVPGLNDVVPQASDAGLQSDKQKAYEEEQLALGQQQKRNALTTLSDYWTQDEQEDKSDMQSDSEEPDGSSPSSSPALKSYKNAQQTLGSFYKEEPSETRELKRQIEELTQQVEQAQQQPTSNVETQLELMEKSYQMAAKYLPANNSSDQTESRKAIHPEPISNNTEKEFINFSVAKTNVVSSLPREPKEDDIPIVDEGLKGKTFLTPTDVTVGEQPKNSVRAVIQETQVVTSEGFVKLRLTEAAQMKGQVVPAGTMLTASAKIQNNRVLLQVTSVELRGSIFSVAIKIHDLDGQLGLPVPYSTERSALTEMAANMSQQSGSSLMLTQSAGQQIAGDLTRGVVQGVSRYFAKKVRAPKVTLKAGHQVFLVSEK